jgi:hypothetical protein
LFLNIPPFPSHIGRCSPADIPSPAAPRCPLRRLSFFKHISRSPSSSRNSPVSLAPPTRIPHPPTTASYNPKHHEGPITTPSPCRAQHDSSPLTSRPASRRPRGTHPPGSPPIIPPPKPMARSAPQDTARPRAQKLPVVLLSCRVVAQEPAHRRRPPCLARRASHTGPGHITTPARRSLMPSIPPAIRRGEHVPAVLQPPERPALRALASHYHERMHLFPFCISDVRAPFSAAGGARKTSYLDQEGGEQQKAEADHTSWRRLRCRASS